ncbi:MAG: MFS transporter, partial [Lachnospiraceae bacterium]|nr:MFS transporter [Lachnospiraceae bacterium]
SWFKDMPMTFIIVWMFASYIIWGSFCYTGINIPYGSMASAISSEPKDRSELSTFRSLGASLAGTVIGVIIPMVAYDKVGEALVMNGTKVTIVAGICSVGAVICYLLCYNMCTERVKVETKTEKFDLGKLLKSLVTNKALIGIVLASICLLLTQLTLSTMVGYIYPDYFKNTAAQSASGIVGTALTLVIAPFGTKLGMKFGKKELGAIGCFWGAAVFLAAFVMKTTNAWVFLVFYTLAYAGVIIFNLLVWAMITDVIDYAEVQTGTRSDGEIYSVYSFARKMGQAASSGLSGALLSMIGYQSGAASQTQEVLDGIYNLTCIVPAIGFVALGLVLVFFYPLGRKQVEENSRILAAKKAGKR